MERGNAKTILKYINEHFSELIKKMGFEMSVANSPVEEIEVTKYPQSFLSYMEGKGYCNRDKYFGYSPADMLSYFVMCKERLFESHDLNMEANEAIGERIKVAELYGKNLKSGNDAIKLHNLIVSILDKGKPAIVDFEGVTSASFDFLLSSFGLLYKEQALERLFKNLVVENVERNAIWDNINQMRRTIVEYRKNPELNKIANFLSS